MIKNSDRRNVLIIHQHFCPPGNYGNNRSYEIAKNLVASGHNITVLTGSGNFSVQPSALFSSQYIDGIKIDCIRVPYNHHMSYLKRICSFLLFFISASILIFRYKKTIDIIYAISTPISVGVLGIWYRKIFQKPFLFEVGDLWPDVPIQMGIIKNKFLIRILYKIESRIYSSSSHIVLLSEGMREYMKQKNIPTDKYSVLYNGTNIQQFSPAPDKSLLRHRYNIPDEKFIVLYAGTIGVANGLEFFVEAAYQIQLSGDKKIKFYFIGSGNRLTAIKKHVLEKNVSNIIFIESMQKDAVIDYFKLADVGIVSFAPFKILDTNSANKYYDYLASGLPVVINYDGWQKNILEQTCSGFSALSPAAATELLIELRLNTSLYQQMSANARLLAEKQYDRHAIAEQLSRLILQHSSSAAYNRKV